MNTTERKAHWEKIYRDKAFEEVSWYQPRPEISIDFIRSFSLPKEANIIDIGGGDSLLVDHLLDMGYENITVLDISTKAIQRAKERLGDRADHVKWIVSDILDFQPYEEYDLWHDRAALHFLTEEEDIRRYVHHLYASVSAGGYAVLGTFSKEGLHECSGLPVQQYSEESLTRLLEDDFVNFNCREIDHDTPFDTLQRFLFCGFQRKK